MKANTKIIARRSSPHGSIHAANSRPGVCDLPSHARNIGISADTRKTIVAVNPSLTEPYIDRPNDKLLPPNDLSFPLRVEDYLMSGEPASFPEQHVKG